MDIGCKYFQAVGGCRARNYHGDSYHIVAYILLPNGYEGGGSL